MFERPLLLWLLVAIPAVAMPGVIAALRGRVAAGASAAVLRAAAFTALVLALAGLRITARVPAHHLQVVALVDQSRSVAPDQEAWMRAEVKRVGDTMGAGDRLAVMGFGRDVRLLSPFGRPGLVVASGPPADRGATNIAAALAAAEGLFSPGTEKRILLLTDGNQTAGDATREIPSLVAAGIRVYTAAPPPSKTERVALAGFQAPNTVRADQRFEFALEIESEAPQAVTVSTELLLDGVPLGSQAVKLAPGLNRFTLPYRIARPGAYAVGARVKAPTPLVVVNPQIETGLTVDAAPRILVVTESPSESLLNALKLREYKVEIASPRSLPERAESYLPYQLVILADTDASAFSPAALEALKHYVADLGGGLIATGATLRDYRFADSTLEQMLPVKFRPQPPPPEREPIAVYLLIDRSNSMSYDSRFPAVRDDQRIRYAKAAAIALLRQLDDTDYVGVIAFDSQPYVLSHLQPLGPDRVELENRIERLQPGGGTDFKEALEIAEREILASGIAVRQVFLLTDGDTNRPYHDHDALIADYAREHIPVSTIRIGPDLANLRLLQDFARATGGTFYRVQNIEKLPLLLVGLTRQAMNRPKQGHATIEPGAPSGILTGFNLHKLPPISYSAVTAPKEDAQVPLLIRRGSRSMPLLAAWQYGLGRTAVFTADPDSLASVGWITWDRYAEFWSQLATWAMRLGDPGMFTLHVEEGADGAFQVKAQKANTQPATNLVVRITSPGRVMDIPMTQAGASLYRADIGLLPRGKYAATLMVKTGDTERALERHPFASAGSMPADAQELKIRPPDLGLLRRLALSTGGALDATARAVTRPRGAMVTVRRSGAGYILPLALILLLGEIFVRRRLLGD